MANDLELVGGVKTLNPQPSDPRSRRNTIAEVQSDATYYIGYPDIYIVDEDRHYRITGGLVGAWVLEAVVAETQVVDVSTLEAYDPLQSYEKDTYRSYVNIDSLNPLFKSPAIYLSMIAAIPGQTPETNPYNPEDGTGIWWYLGERVTVSNRVTSKSIVRNLTELRLLVGPLDGDNVGVVDPRMDYELIYEFDSLSTSFEGIRPNSIPSDQPGRWEVLCVREMAPLMTSYEFDANFDFINLYRGATNLKITQPIDPFGIYVQPYSTLKQMDRAVQFDVIIDNTENSADIGFVFDVPGEISWGSEGELLTIKSGKKVKYTILSGMIDGGIDMSYINHDAGGGSSGHTIKDADESFSQRTGLKFSGNFIVTDNEAGDETIIEVAAGTIAHNTLAGRDLAGAHNTASILLKTSQPLSMAVNQDELNSETFEKISIINNRVTSLEGATGLKCMQPIISVNSNDELILTSNPSFAEIKYTLNGTRPTYGSDTYSIPISITGTTQVRAIARALGYIDSLEIDSTAIPSSFPVGITGRLAHYDFTNQSNIILNGSNVSQINDISGNGYNLAQSTVASQPLYITSDGLKRVRMVSGKSLANALPPSYTGYITYFIAAKITSTIVTGRDKIIGLSSGTFNNIFILGRNISPDQYQSVALVTSNLDVDKSLGVDSSVITVHSGLNAVNFYSTTNKIIDKIEVAADITTNALMIGGMTSNSIAEIAEVVIYNRQLSDSEIYNVNEFLYLKYSFSPLSFTVLGDSIATGTSAAVKFGFAMMAINQLKGKRYNLALTSTGSEYALNQVNDNFNRIPIGKILIELGTNEPAATTGIYLPQIVDRLIERGISPSNIYILSLPYRSTDGQKTLDHEAVCINLANTKGITYVDVWRPMLAAGGDLLISDGVHPTTAGHRIMADQLLLQL